MWECTSLHSVCKGIFFWSSLTCFGEKFMSGREVCSVGILFTSHSRGFLFDVDHLHSVFESVRDCTKVFWK